MTEQPLHETCDKIYNHIVALDTIQNNLDHMRIVTASHKLKIIERELNSILSTVREIALRTEGEHS